MKEILREVITHSVSRLGLDVDMFSIEHPSDVSHGDYATNVAMILAKRIGENPRDLAQKIADDIMQNQPIQVEAVEVAGPGFINFYLSKAFFAGEIAHIHEQKEQFGKNQALTGETIMMEFTNPNPFKQFHIGHLMSNTIGEAISRIFEWSGAEIIRANYQGDVGLHVAKALYGMEAHKRAFPHDTDALDDKVKFLGDAYVYGATQYEEDTEVRAKIDELNKQIYKYVVGHDDATDENIHVAYTKGREWSLAHFEELYKKLGTAFDFYFFESEVAKDGVRLVEEYKTKGLFEESDGAIIFKGENHGLHTRVFINSKGVPTYETKDLGLVFAKEERTQFDQSYVITAVEQKEYYRVVLAAMEHIDPVVAKKTHHISHGMMRFKEGKMSSRTGNVITGESLLTDLEEVVFEKMKDRDVENKEKVATQIAVAALKYSILRQSPGKDIAFDREQALSFEGDSGPYLQYTCVRTKSLLEKAKKENLLPDTQSLSQENALTNTHVPDDWQTTTVEKLLYRFPEVVMHAYTEQAPQHIVTFLTELAGAFNSFYANHQIIDANDSASGYKVALTEAVGIVLENGLNALGIEVPEKM